MSEMKTFSLLIAWDDNDCEKGEFGDTVRAVDAETAEAIVRERMAEYDRNEYGYTDEELADMEYGRVIDCHEGAIWKAAELERALRNLFSWHMGGSLESADLWHKAATILAEIDAM